MEEQKPTARFIFPDASLFVEEGDGNIANVVNPSNSVITANRVFWHKETEYPESGGIYKHYHGCLYPETCLPFPQGINGANFGKRDLLLTFQLYAKHPFIALIAFLSKGWLSDELKRFNEAADKALGPFYFRRQYPRYYSPASKEIKKGIDAFLTELGADSTQVFNFSRIVMTCLDNDNAYRYRAQDIAEMTTKEALLKDFRHEFKRIVEVYSTHELGQWSEFMKNKLVPLEKITKVAWFIPKFRRAIKKAIEAMTWENLVMAPCDYYHTLIWMDYNYHGRTFEDRLREFRGMHEKAGLPPPPMIEFKPI